jgi:hypothetical protein
MCPKNAAVMAPIFIESDRRRSQDPARMPTAKKEKCSATWMAGLSTAASQGPGRCQKAIIIDAAARRARGTYDLPPKVSIRRPASGYATRAPATTIKICCVMWAVRLTSVKSSKGGKPAENTKRRIPRNGVVLKLDARLDNLTGCGDLAFSYLRKDCIEAWQESYSIRI